jgi:polar amino acid transport system substrate-binding protein
LSVLLAVSLLLTACDLVATPSPTLVAPTPTSLTASGLPNLNGYTIRVAVENSYPPFNFIDQATGQAMGYDYDLFNDACQRLNCTPEFVQTSWDSVVAVMAGSKFADFDVAADGITITEERAQYVDFSDAYLSIAQRILVRADESRFKTAEELKNRPELKVGAQPDTTNYALGEQIVGKERLVLFDTYGLIIQALLSKDIDASIIDDVAGSDYINANPGRLKVLDDVLTSEDLGFVFPKGSPLREMMNATLKQMKADGTLDRLKARWFPGIE